MVWRLVFNFFLFIILPLSAFAAGYRLTDWYFRWKMIPHPFENFGWATGLGFFWFALGVAALTRHALLNRRKNP